MKIATLAIIVASLACAAPAQATPVYDQDGTRLDTYGRIALGVAGGGAEFDGQGNKINNSVEFVDVYSRLGFRMSQAISDDLTAFGHLEWRFRADGGMSRFGTFHDTRQSYIGLQSARYGKLQAGNFDSLYYQFVSAPFDVYLDRGLLFKSTGLQSRGDALGYSTPTINGVTAFLQLKHYSERGTLLAEQPQESSVLAAQGGVRYQRGPLTIGLGAVEDVVRGGGNGEMLYGLIGSFAINDPLTARLGLETQDHSDTYGGGFDTLGVGGTYVTGPWTFTADYYHVERHHRDNSHAWAAGGYYRVSSAFDVFLELADGNTPKPALAEGLSDDIYWITGARYLF